MATIADTFNQIPKLQDRIAKLLSRANPLDAEFLTEAANFTSVLYFGLLSHACLDNPVVKSTLAFPKIPEVEKYNELFQNALLLCELIRWQNIGGIFCVWVTLRKVYISPTR